MYIGTDAFSQPLNDQAAKDLFAKSVKRFEVETHSYCNRRCDYCPNVVGDRLGDNKRMADHIWDMIISNLADISYPHNMVFTSYNEPLADRIIIDRVRQARENLPRARLMIYSNGDYLNAKYLEELAAAGLDYLHVSIHTRHGGVYSEVSALNSIFKLGRRLALPMNFKSVKAGQFIVAQVPHPRVEIEVRAINYWQHGTDRGGLIESMKKPAVRTLPCYFPFTHFHVGFQGTVVPCCHIRSDNDMHKPYRYGTLDEFGSIFAAYASRVATEWRRDLISTQAKKAPCNTCSVAYLSDAPETLARTEQVWRTRVLANPLPDLTEPLALLTQPPA